MPFGKVAVLLSLGFILFGLNPVFAQKSKAQLEAERQASIKQINEMSTILERTTSRRSNSIDELYAINRRVEAQEEYLGTIQAEVSALEGEITELDEFIQALEADLQAFKDEYAALLYSAQKANLSDNRLLFMLSAQSFNEFWMRLNYMRQYGETRRDQAEQIRFVRDELTRQLADAALKKDEQEELYASQLVEQKKLEGLKDKQSDLISSLGNEEERLKSEIAQRKKEVEALEETIAELVRKELERRNNTVGPAPATPAAEALSAGFQSNRKKLPWPVASGFISLRFGRQKHPVIRGAEINNDGIDIRTNANETALAVFDGTVTNVAVMPPPYYYAVLIRHGEYFTVYTKVTDVLVKSGQTVRTKDPIGTVVTNGDGITELQFQIRRSTDLLNPEQWLKRK